MLKFKKIKKTVALVMALAFCLCALPTVIAADENTIDPSGEPSYALSGTMSSLITIMENPTEWGGGADDNSGQINIKLRDTDNGAIFTAYKLLNITNVNGTLQVSIPDDAQNFWNKYTGKAEGVKATIADIKTKIAGQETEAEKSSSIVDAFVKYDGREFTKASSSAVDAGTAKITTDFGFYAILQTGAPVSGYIASAPVLACLPMKKDINGTPTWLSAYTVQPKDDTISITKQVKATDDDDTYKDETITNIGNTVSYEIIAELPKYGADIANSGITYTIVDKLPDGITIDESSISAALLGKDDPNYVTNDTYKPSYGTDAETSKKILTLNIENYGTTINGLYDKIKITYSATLNGSAVVEGDGNVNTATLTYSSYVGETSTTDAKAKVYTMGLDITKIEKDSYPTKTLAGAEFEVHLKQDGSDAAIQFIDITGEKNLGINYYRVAAPGETGTTTIVVTNSADADKNGKLMIDGLNDTTYYLKETKQPVGYNLPKDLFKIEVAPTKYIDGTATDDYTDNTNTILDFDGNRLSKNIANSTSIDLPVTGGMGTVIFTAIGLLLMAGAAYFLFRGKKSSN